MLDKSKRKKKGKEKKETYPFVTLWFLSPFSLAVTKKRSGMRCGDYFGNEASFVEIRNWQKMEDHPRRNDTINHQERGQRRRRLEENTCPVHMHRKCITVILKNSAWMMFTSWFCPGNSLFRHKNIDGCLLLSQTIGLSKVPLTTHDWQRLSRVSGKGFSWTYLEMPEIETRGLCI